MNSDNESSTLVDLLQPDMVQPVSSRVFVTTNPPELYDMPQNKVSIWGFWHNGGYREVNVEAEQLVGHRKSPSPAEIGDLVTEFGGDNRIRLLLRDWRGYAIMDILLFHAWGQNISVKAEIKKEAELTAKQIFRFFGVKLKGQYKLVPVELQQGLRLNREAICRAYKVMISTRTYPLIEVGSFEKSFMVSESPQDETLRRMMRIEISKGLQSVISSYELSRMEQALARNGFGLAGRRYHTYVFN